MPEHIRNRPWNRNIHYHPLVLSAVPSPCRRTLDVGCGDGLLARELANRSGEVVGVDVDAPTLARARAANRQANLIFVEGDVMRYPFDVASFDCITSIATLHHLPLAAALERFKDLLSPGGVLAVIGLYRLRTPTDFLWAHAAMPVTWWMRATTNVQAVMAPIRDPDETFEEIKKAVAAALPGAVFTRRLLFRYSLVWRKPLS